MLRIFIGYDQRAPVQYHVLAHSIAQRASEPIAITPLSLRGIPLTRRGLTDFTYSRFLVPWLCDFDGPALFLDSDMLALADVAELFDTIHSETKTRNDGPAVLVRKSPWRFEWASVMLFDCGHSANTVLTPDYIEDPERCKVPHWMDWCSEDELGALPAAWNHMVLYDEPRHDAKLVHFTGGIPLFEETRGCEYSHEWMEEAREVMSSICWPDLMGGSVHREKVEAFNRGRVASVG